MIGLRRLLIAGAIAGALLVVRRTDAQAPEVVPPQIIERSEAVYPEEELRARHETEVIVAITVTSTGAVVSPEVLQSASPAFALSALEAIRKWRFSPALRDGVPIPVRMRAIVHFELPEELTAIATSSTSSVATSSIAKPPPPALAETETATRAPPPIYDVLVRGYRRPASRGASDFYVDVGALRAIPRANATDYLKLAPGVLLTNEGGEGHAERIYLRGFDAREGQDVEFLVNGVPFNEVGNPHGEGYADTHFIIPELIQSVRVLEGPFDPHQGNYAVAGTAEYVLGRDEPGLTIGGGVGSFNTYRLLLLYGDSNPATFAGVDLRKSDGFGENRAALLARAMGQYELRLGGTRTLRIFSSGYVTRFGSAGVVRQDDFESGRLGFFDTYDPSQGGDVSRFGVSIAYGDHGENRAVDQQFFAALRDLRLRFNFTGFLEDPPAAFRSGFGQRGDGSDQTYQTVTVGGRGSLRLAKEILGQKQSIEAGYFARLDRADSAQRRLRFGTVVPYRVDFDLGQTVANLALFVDLELRPLSWITLRGGVRGDLFHYDVFSRCDLHDVELGSATPVQDLLCYDIDRNGPRDPTARRSAFGTILQPRGTLVIGPWQGISLTGSTGVGSRAADPIYLADGNDSPFAKIFGAEGGVLFNGSPGDVSVTARALYYYTRVSRDLIFNQQLGRNSLAPGTLRQGALVALRATGSFFDVSGSATFAHAQFKREAMDPGAVTVPPDFGDRVPFVGNWVLRADAVFFGPLSFLTILGDPIQIRGSVGASYVSPRSLPYDELGQSLLVVDAAAGVRWKMIDADLSSENILGSTYRLSEFNYVSEFRQDTQTPDFVPERHFTAGAPRSFFFTVTVHLDVTGSEGP